MISKVLLCLITLWIIAKALGARFIPVSVSAFGFILLELSWDGEDALGKADYSRGILGFEKDDEFIHIHILYFLTTTRL
jgi:hypothetical protein